MSGVLLILVETCSSTFSLVATNSISIGYSPGTHSQNLQAAISHIENKNVEALERWIENVSQKSWKYSRQHEKRSKLLFNFLKTIPPNLCWTRLDDRSIDCLCSKDRSRERFVFTNCSISFYNCLSVSVALIALWNLFIIFILMYTVRQENKHLSTNKW